MAHMISGSERKKAVTVNFSCANQPLEMLPGDTLAKKDNLTAQKSLSYKKISLNH